jgi:hypothetical protein
MNCEKSSMAIGGDGQTRENAILASRSGASVPERHKRWVTAPVEAHTKTRDLLVQFRWVS